MKRSEKQGKKERYIQINTDFQRIKRRTKKAFFNEHCIKLEEEKNSKSGKTRDLFRKTRDIRGTVRPKMGIIKGRNGRDLLDTKEIKKRWKEHTEALYEKELNELDSRTGAVSHPEPDSLDCDVKQALGSTAINKASGCGGILVETPKALEDDATEVLHSLRQQI